MEKYDYEWTKNAFLTGKPEINNNRTECIMLPAKVNSAGVWDRENPFHDYLLPHVQILILIVFCLCQFLHFFLKKIGILRFTTQMIVGVLLSPYCHKLNKSLNAILHPQEDMTTVIAIMGAFGHMMFYLLQGVKMNIEIMRTTGTKAILVGVGAVLTPMVVNIALFHKNWNEEAKLRPSISGETTVVMAMSWQTAFPVVALLMTELKIQNSELGRLALSAALFSDLLAVLLNVLATSAFELKIDIVIAVKDVVAILSFMAFAVYFFRPAMLWIIKRTPEGRPVKDYYVYFILVFVFGSGLYIDKVGQFLPVGPFVLGLAIPSGAPLGSAFVDKFDSLTSAIFVPLYVTVSMLKFGTETVRSSKMGLAGSIIIHISTFFSKFLFTLSAAYLSKMPLSDSLALAFAMSKKGISSLAVLYFSLEKGFITAGSYKAGVIYILIVSAIVPYAVRYLYDPSRKYAGYKKRDMMHLKKDTPLRILSCIHRPNNISPMANLLEASCSSVECAISVYVLHLVELVGQTQPLFISHNMHKESSRNISYSNNVIISFNQLQNNCMGINVNYFTSISSLKLMHEDICMAALDNLTSLIVLPFHRTWSIDGSTIISDNQMIRRLNCSVLGLAPCSVGILIDRSRLGGRTVRKARGDGASYQVCMIFMGGGDDREALALAKRMAKDSRTEVTILRFLPAEGPDVAAWETMLDVMQLDEVRQIASVNGNVRIIEQVVNDGTETAMVLNKRINEFDLFLVGKGDFNTALTKGLDVWSEFKELGVIGDLLASPDLDSRASIFVVQQQQQLRQQRHQ